LHASNVQAAVRLFANTITNMTATYAMAGADAMFLKNMYKSTEKICPSNSRTAPSTI